MSGASGGLEGAQRGAENGEGSRDVLGVDHARADAVVRWRNAERGGTMVRGQPFYQSVPYRFLKDYFQPRHGWREKKKHRAAHDEAEGHRRGGRDWAAG